MHQVIRIAFAVWISVALWACAGPKKNIVDENAKTMQEVYAEKFGGDKVVDHSHRRRTLNDGAVDLKGYTRDASNELEALFPIVPNPTLIMYIYPHATSAGREVPGYSSRLKMYRQEHYALPGEMEGWE